MPVALPSIYKTVLDLFLGVPHLTARIRSRTPLIGGTRPSFVGGGLEQSRRKSHNGGFQRPGDRIFAFVQGRVFADLRAECRAGQSEYDNDGICENSGRTARPGEEQGNRQPCRPPVAGRRGGFPP